jgi:hypothetical protein
MARLRAVAVGALLQLGIPLAASAQVPPRSDGSTTLPSGRPSAAPPSTAALHNATTIDQAAALQSPRAVEPRPHRLTWSYPRFRIWQYLMSGALTGGNLYLQYGTGPFPDHRWSRPILFDNWARGIRADTEEGRLRAAKISDYMWHATQYYTVLVDSLIVPLAFDRFNLDVAVQMNLLNWQSIAVSFFILRLSHVSVGRARPSEYGCSTDEDAAFRCGEGTGPSFMGGHTAMSAAGAGLACAHHMAFPLYGGGIPDIAACAVLSTSAVTVGVLRGVSDKHWASDNIIGGLLGGAIGFGLPYFLHYSRGRRPEPLGAAFLPRNMALAPLMSDHVWGIGLSGWL